MSFTVPLLRAALAVRRLSQGGLPGAAGAGLRRAAALRVSGAERPAERAIDALRARLRASADPVDVGDGREVRVGHRYRRVAAGPAWGRFLFGLVRGMRPSLVLEVGTGLGVGAAHLAAALALNEAEDRGHPHLVALERSPALAALAAGHLGRLGHSVGAESSCRVRVEAGPPEASLAGLAEGTVELAVLGASVASPLDVLAAVAPHLAPGALVVVGGVGRGGGARPAWRALRAAAPGAPAVDLGRVGLIVHAPPEGGGAGPADLGAATAAARESPSPHPTAGPA